MFQKILKPLFPVSNYIESIYYLGGNSRGIQQTIIPDGKADLLLNFDSNINVIRNDKNILLKKSIFQGIRKNTYTFKFDNNVNIVGIRFYPFGFSSLFKIPEAEIGEHPIDARLINKILTEELEERVYSVNDISEKLKIVESFFLNFIIKNSSPELSLQHTLSQMKSSKGVLPVQKLYESEADYKKIQRTFKNILGISPKLYSRMLRFEHLHYELRTKKAIDWFKLIAKYNFHDQSHIIKEFKYFSGVTPKEFLTSLDSFI